MKDSGHLSLGFRLTLASIGVAAAAVLIAGLIVYNLSLDAVKKRQLGIVKEMAEVLSSRLSAGAGEQEIISMVTSFKTEKVGGTWLMTQDGELLASPESVHSDYLGEAGGFGDLEAKLLAAETAEGRWTRRPGETHVLKFRDIGSRYVSAFGEYKIDGQKRVAAFSVVPGTDLIAGVDEPVAAAYSQHREIRKYILITCLAIAAIISSFTWIALKKIIRPYYRELEEKSNEVAASNALLSSVSGYLHSDRVFSALAELTAKQFDVDRALAFSYDRPSRVLRFFGKPGETSYGMTVPLGEGGSLVADCIRLRQTLKRRVDKNYPILESVSETYDKAYEALAVPITSGDEVMGAIVVDNSTTGRSLMPDKTESISEVSHILTSVIARARAHERLHQRAETLAVTDTLTGLYDQDYLLARLREELVRMGDPSQPLSVLLCEVKRFREMNIERGVKFGNDVLMSLAGAIKSVVRLDDVPARFGGSLFAIILPGSNSRDAVRWGENLRLEFAENNPGNNVEGLEIELGIGVFTTANRNLSEDYLLDRALEALNEAGRVSGGGIAVWSEGDKGDSGRHGEKNSG